MSDKLVDQAVRDLYERFPYPTKSDMGPLEISYIIANPKDSHALYFPDLEFRDDLSILVAGCGTNLVPAFGASLPNAQVVGIDISGASLSHSRAMVEELGLKNCELHQLSIESAASLGRQFDFINCHGVLHHLKSPSEGLRVLGSLLAPEGAMSIMLYARYGRCGVYQLQDLCRRLGLGANERHAETLRGLLGGLPHNHQLSILLPEAHQSLPLEEVADLLLHPRDRPYTVEDVRDLVEGTGLRFHRWIGQGIYSPEISPLWIDSLKPVFRHMDHWQRAAAMELYYGVIHQHRFVVTLPDRPTPEELFTDEAFDSAIPARSPDLKHTATDESITLFNPHQQVPIRVTFNPGLELNLLKAIDGERTIAEIVSTVGEGNQSAQWRERGSDFFRQLYLADIVHLSVHPRP
jgi:SAM-dependent methyltransferase